MILKIGTIEAEIIVDALVDRVAKLESAMDGLKEFHLNGSFLFAEIEAHNNLVKLIKER